MTFDLRLGSCLDPVSGLASLADGSVDVTIMDPPYEIEAHTKGRRENPAGWRSGAPGDGRGVVEAPLPFPPITEADRVSVSQHVARLTRRWVLVFCQVEASVAWAGALSAAGAGYVRTMIWTKPDAQPQLTGDRPGVGYESIVVCHRKGRKRWNGGGRCGVFEFNKNGNYGGGKNPHPTTKPLPLMEELIGLFSDSGELVLDPYSGSGSTGVAALKHGRRFIGWELDAGFHAIAERRLRGDAWRVQEHQPELFAGVA